LSNALLEQRFAVRHPGATGMRFAPATGYAKKFAKKLEDYEPSAIPIVALP
jgi:hypothetical protein